MKTMFTKMGLMIALIGTCFALYSHTVLNGQARSIRAGSQPGWFDESQTPSSRTYQPGTRYDAWQKGKNYDKDDIVKHGAYLGIDLHWKAKWSMGGNDEPGMIPDSGGTSGWAILNTKDPDSNADWEGCDDEPSRATTVCIPTWMDGAKGAYSIISDDLGALPREAYERIWKYAKEVNDKEYVNFNRYNAIRVAFGVQVNEATEGDWKAMREQVLAGHEMLCHSYDHTSAAHQWLWFYQCDAEGETADEINDFTKSGGDTLPISGVLEGADDPEVKHLAYVKKLQHVGKDLPAWASGAIVLSKAGYDAISGTESTHNGYTVKNTSDGRYISANTKQWINKTQPEVLILDCAARSDDLKKHYDGWDGEEFSLNVEKAADTIDMKVYDKLRSDLKKYPYKQYWAADKKTEYYVYPYDAYSKSTHEYLNDKKFVGARGGSKSPDATPLDFFQPFRTMFDAHYGDELGEYPDNPHQYLSLTRMLKVVTESKGYHTREIHTVTDENIGWGIVKPEAFKKHLNELMEYIKRGDIFMYPPTQAVKYRLVSDNTTASVSRTAEDKWTLKAECSLTGADKEKYDNYEICFVVTLPADYDSKGKTLFARYKDSKENTRRNPRMLKRRNADNKWAVYANPFKGELELYMDVDAVADMGNLTKGSVKLHGLQSSHVSFVGVKGDYSVKVFDLKGKMVHMSQGRLAKDGFTKASINARTLAKGMYIVKLTNNMKTVEQSFVLNK